jgi:NADPH:quinone reductase-like Zn-dependent oxidoreductase
MMSDRTAQTMQAAAIDQFGGAITPHTLPVPQVEPDEVLIRVEIAGVGVWDSFEKAGGFARMMGTTPHFPYVLGSDGAGTVIRVGDRVKRLNEGDRVYAMALANAKGGFHAQYIVVKEDQVSPVPGRLSIEEAGVMPVDGITALMGLDDTLGLKRGESVMVFGASGGIGHLAVQLAKRMGARVFAVASGDDGAALARQLGADAVVDGHKDGILDAARKFAPDGIDAALVTAGGKQTDAALMAVRDGGRIAFPSGVEPEPRGRPGVSVKRYDAMPMRQAIEKLNSLIEAGPFEVHVARTFALSQAAEAERALAQHYLGKLALRPN